MEECPSCGGNAWGQEIKDEEGNVVCIRYECQYCHLTWDEK